MSILGGILFNQFAIFQAGGEKGLNYVVVRVKWETLEVSQKEKNKYHVLKQIYEI